MIVPGSKDNLQSSPADVYRYAAKRAPGFGEFLGASASDAYERTTSSAFGTETQVIERERELYGSQAPGVIEDVNNIPGLYDDSLRDTVYDSATYDYGYTPEYISKEDWNENNPLFRPGIDWREGMTAVRAEVYAEDYDNRLARQGIIERGSNNFGVLRGTIPGFIADMVGSLPDPINIIPAGAFIRGGSLGRVALRGAAEGAIGNAAVDAIVLPDLASRGADVGFLDFTLDVAFGGVLGAGLGTAGYAVSRSFSRSGFASSDISAEYRNGANDLSREKVTGQDREDIVNSLGTAIDDMMNARDSADISGILGTSGALDAVQLRTVASRLIDGGYEYADLGPLSSSTRQALSEFEIEGRRITQGENLVLPSDVVQILDSHGAFSKAHSADDVADVLLSALRGESDPAIRVRGDSYAATRLRSVLESAGFLWTNENTGRSRVRRGYFADNSQLRVDLEAGGMPEPISFANDPRILRTKRNVSLAKAANEDSILYNPLRDGEGAAAKSSATERGILDAAERTGDADTVYSGADDIAAAEAIESGRAAPEDAAEFREADNIIARLDKEQETGLSVLECVTEII